MSQHQFEITPIGAVYDDGVSQIVEITRKYCRGLKYISLFSHVILIYQDESMPNIFNTSLCQKAAALKKADEKQGMLIVHGLGTLGDRKVLYDIKPYFPNEDRVKGAITPPQLSCNNAAMYRPSLSKLGTIRKVEGNYYLEIPNHFEQYARSLQGFSHIKIFWWFHKFEKDVYKKTLECSPPYENAPKTGVFASRSPVRPNPLAITTAKIAGIDEKAKHIRVSVLDCFDDTPLLGISPYIPERDYVSDYHLPHWLEHWPEYMDDNEFKAAKEPELLNSSTSLFQKYMDTTLAKNTIDTVFPDIDQNQSDMPSPNKALDTGIVIRGARQNNLKSINVTIPYKKTTVITGVSGSGKSSLAFDTIYAESQYRFFASMSLAERSQFALLKRPIFDYITGLPPAIAISQQNINQNPRSTVGTATDLYHLLRTLFANAGVRHCPKCGNAIVKMDAAEIIADLMACKASTHLSIKPFQADTFSETLIVPNRSDLYRRAFDFALDQAVREAITLGLGAIQVKADQEIFTFQTTEKCYHCGHILFEMTASAFSFNNPESMCPVCNGLGTVMDIDESLIIKYPDKSLLDGASPFWGALKTFQAKPNANWMKGEIIALANDLGVDLSIPWKNLPKDFKMQAIYGSNGKEVSFTYKNENGRSGTIIRPVQGAYHILKGLLKTANTENQQTLAKKFTLTRPCDCCKGERLKLESRLVTVAGKRFPEVVQMNLEELRDWIRRLPGTLDTAKAKISKPILQEMYMKLTDYIKIGLGYLTLDRATPTLSGGEWQRLQLVSQLNSGLSNILYILDEPTAGLHPKDYKKLMEIINKLQELHNTVIIVEHAPEIMWAADNILDIGPGAGESGGRLTAQGTPKEIAANKDSETGLYLSGKKALELRHKAILSKKNRWISLTGIHGNNLQNIDISFPENAIICITGVSGSGKSSLINYGILPAVQSCIDRFERPEKTYGSILGAENIHRIKHITQKPIGRSSRSTPATYTGIMDELRSIFAKTDMAKELKYTQSKFSFNSKDGQCPVCRGYGYKSLDAAFMPSTKIECPLCKGKKFQSGTMQVLYRGKNISQVLDMNIREALEFFKDNEKMRGSLQLLEEIGLGYITLGQSSVTLSGGEAQRIKLAAELHSSNDDHTLYLLDEPAAGLHFSDIQNLLYILDKIVEHGSTVILVEHNLEIIKNADWIIDLGPDGGNHGGRLMAQGAITDIMNCPDSRTGQLLKKKHLITAPTLSC